MITAASLFTGIGTFDLAAENLGLKNVFMCENDKWCIQHLKNRFPGIPNLGDIKIANFKPYANTINIISGGFPCQNISISGKGEGIYGEHSGMWKYMAQAIYDIRPECVIIENSSELLKKGFEQILCDFSDIGYTVEWECLQASYFGKRHKRKRLFVIAYPNEKRWSGILHYYKRSLFKEGREKYLVDTQSNPFLQFEKRYSQPGVFRMADGLAKKLDGSNRLGACGNALVYEIAYDLMKLCKELIQFDNHVNKQK